MAISYEKLFKIFSANLKKSHPAQAYLQRHSLSPNIGIGYNAQGWDQLQHCLIFPLKRQHDRIVGFYGHPITHLQTNPNKYSSGRWYVPKRQGFYPRYPDPYIERLLLTGSILEAAVLWQMHPVWENYTVLACYSPQGLTKEQQVAIASLQALREVVLFFGGAAAPEKANPVLARIVQQLQPLSSSVKMSEVDVPLGETVHNLDASTRLYLLEHRRAYSLEREKQNPEKRNLPLPPSPPSDAAAGSLLNVSDKVKAGPESKEGKGLARPALDRVTLSWIDEQEAQYGISDYELSLQVGQVRNYLYQIRSGKMRISRGVKAAMWHFFQRLNSQ